MLEAAGFVDVQFDGWTGYHTSGCTQGGLIRATKPLGEGTRA